MTSITKKTIFLSILGIMVIAIAAGLFYYFKPPPSAQFATGKKVTATDLYQSFITDSTKAKAAFADKVLEVSGNVTGVSQNQQKQVVIMLKTGTPGAAVNCTLEGPGENIKQNDNIIIKGFCWGLGAGDADLGILGDVYLGRCYIVK